MLTGEARDWICRHAYIPEHLPDYVSAISGATPHLIDNCLCYLRRQHLVFVGYALDQQHDHAEQAYRTACKHLKPLTTTILAPRIWPPHDQHCSAPSDHYYRLDLPVQTLSRDVAYMLRRAKKEVRITMGKFGREHRKLVKQFLTAHDLSAVQLPIYARLKHYLKQSKTAFLIEARKSGKLIAFNITDIGSQDYAFYMFNIRSPQNDIPGTSDLLFSKMVSLAQNEAKRFINLGLGINAGICRFKRKWGGVEFKPHCSVFVELAKDAFQRLAGKL